MDRVKDFASAHDLFISGGRYIVALSGGADSVALLLTMLWMKDTFHFSVEAAHCNFHLRGDESTRDERFCSSLCSRLGVKLHLIHFATKDYAELHHVSIEMAARDLRYNYFSNLCRDLKATGICVAHHRDDSVETVLLNLVRGTGIRGLRGIQPCNGNIIRPLLCVSRQDILKFLSEQKQDYVTDSTNLKNDVKRNKIRLDIIPLLKQLNPNVCQSIFDTSIRIGEAFNVYEDAITRSIVEVCEGGICSVDKPVTINLQRLFEQASAESTLFSILSQRGFTSTQVADIYVGLTQTHGIQSTEHPMRQAGVCRSGGVVTSATHELLFDRRRIIVQPVGFGICTKQMTLPETGIYILSNERRLKVTEMAIDDDFVVSRERMSICVDADKVDFPLVIRPVLMGERFVPFGMSTSKLVSDYMTDSKRTLFDKRRQLILTDAKGKVVWLVGERTDNRVRITTESRRALLITYM